MEIKVAHSPDSDDAFMFYALANDKLDTGNLEFTHKLVDIESLNQMALDNPHYEVTALSFHAYAYLSDKYAVLPSGGSMGENYGPMIVAKKDLTIEDLKGMTIAIPGEMTSAYLALKLFLPDCKTVTYDFNKIMDAIEKGEVEAGLIIHEGQVLYESMGFKKIVDLGEWWHERTNGLPLPLGCNGIRKDLGMDTMKEVSRLLKASIQHALDNREDALNYALTFARGMDPKMADKFVGMYVNNLTLDYGADGRKAIQLLLDEGYEKGIIPNKVTVEFID
ncbi:MAG: ABC transporter substrate-binding protein [Calditrichaeota bacterium]|nr:MAG: ABC transporter substrate-binding protein [Calditrichota bacterium]